MSLLMQHNFASGEEFHKSAGLPSFKIVIQSSAGSFVTGAMKMKSCPMPFKDAERGVKNLAVAKQIHATIEFSPE